MVAHDYIQKYFCTACLAHLIVYLALGQIYLKIPVLIGQKRLNPINIHVRLRHLSTKYSVGTKWELKDTDIKSLLC